MENNIQFKTPTEGLSLSLCDVFILASKPYPTCTPAARSVFPLPPLMLSDSSAFSCLWMINRWQICFIGTSRAELSQCHFWHRCHREENWPSYLSLSFLFFTQLCDSLKLNHWKQCRLLLKTTSLMSEDPPDKVMTEEHAVLGTTRVRLGYLKRSNS